MTPAMLVMLSVIGVALVAYAAWLGTTVVRMGNSIVGIEKDVKSLLDTRVTQTAEKGAGVDQRLADLERGVPAPPAAAASKSSTLEAAEQAVDAAEKTVVRAEKTVVEAKSAEKPEGGDK